VILIASFIAGVIFAFFVIALCEAASKPTPRP
jgi:hypothetical protein